jgi:magnesium transporter
VQQTEPPVGSRPGTLIIAPDAAATRLRAVLYDVERIEEHEITSTVELGPLLVLEGKLWVDVQGLGDERLLKEIAALFEIHELALEDAVNVPQRPDTHRYEHHQLVLTRAATIGESGDPNFEQVSVFVGERFVLTIQERHSTKLDAVLGRLRHGEGVIRKESPGYLAYAVLDAVIDGYFPVVETMGDQLDELEHRVLTEPNDRLLSEVNRIRRELLLLRRALWPMREMVNMLVRDPTPFIDLEIQVYLHDCYDHCIQLLDVVESYRELCGGLTATYLSAVGNRTNEVMKVLTMIASIFIPLSFLAGLYGMNFRYMPELSVPWAYPTLLGVMAAVVIGMVSFFWHRGWIGSGWRHASWRQNDD